MRSAGGLCDADGVGGGGFPGVGQAIEEKVIQFLETGKIKAYEDVIKIIPETTLEVMEVPSVGPKKAKLFFDELKLQYIHGFVNKNIVDP